MVLTSISKGGSIIVGTGSPEGSREAPPGYRYYQSNAAKGSEWWDKVTGTGSTGWERRTHSYADLSRVNVEAVAGAPITRSGIPASADTDDVTLVADDYVFLENQTSGVDNGPWQVKSGAWVRPPEYASGSTALSGLRVYVADGTSNADRTFRLRFDVVVGTDSPSFVRTEQSADETSLDPGAGEITETDVQTGIEGLDSRLVTHKNANPAHPASNISLADTGGYYTGNNLETVLQEIGAGGIGGGGGSGGNIYTQVELLSIASQRTAWTDMPAAETALRGSTSVFHQGIARLDDADQVALFTEIGGVPGAAAATLWGQYSLDGSTWKFFDGTASGGTPGGVSRPINANTNGVSLSSFVTLPGEITGLVHLRVVGVGGDGALDPALGRTGFMFRHPVGVPTFTQEFTERMSWPADVPIATGASGVWESHWGFDATVEQIWLGTDVPIVTGPVQLKIHSTNGTTSLPAVSDSTRIYPVPAATWTTLAVANGSRAKKTEAGNPTEGLPLTVFENDRWQMEFGTVGSGYTKFFIIVKGTLL